VHFVGLFFVFHIENARYKKQTTLVQSDTTHVYCNSVGDIYRCATCFGLYLDRLQACQYKNLSKALPLYGSGIDITDDGLSTSRNM